MSSAGNRAVFLSYASQDTEAAQRICDALRAAGVEVWFDQNELVGGDAWDAKIRQQIAECALFVPIISANTQARLEGYFRLEWKIAARRTHSMAAAKAFLLPVVIDTTPDTGAHVPEEFREVQWTRLPQGETSEKFCGRVVALIGGASAQASTVPASSSVPPDHRPPSSARRKWPVLVAVAVFAALGVALWLGSRGETATATTRAADAALAPAPGGTSLAHAWALLEDDPLMTRANVELAEQIGLQTLAKEPTNAEANALCAWTNFLYLLENYDDSPQRVADLKKYADKAKLLAPDSIHAELAMCGVLVTARQFDEAFRRLQALADRAPNNLTVQRIWAWTITWGRGATWSVGQDGEHPAMQRLRALSPMGRAYADAFAASRAWARGNYPEADRIVDGVFASGHPVRLTYLNRLLVLTYGWGDLAAAREFVKTIPAKLLLEDVFICHVSMLWFFSGEYDQMLATLDRASRPLLHEARVVTPTAELRGRALAAAGRHAAAALQWQEALKLVNQRLERESDNPSLRTSRAIALARLGQREAARQEVALVGELEKAVPGNLTWALHYELTNELGDLDDTIARLDRAIASDNSRWPNTYNHLRYEPTFAKVRADPRGQAILARGAQWLAELRAKGAAGAPAAVAAPVDEKSVAVLAFANLSSDKEQEYFSDGISEELLNVLAKVPGLKVSARTSAFFFKGKDTPIPEIAQKLGVAYVVEGSVRKSGDKVRITAQLIKAADGFHVWSDTFTRDLKDIFAVQDEIAGLIAKNLSLQLGASSPRRTAPVNPQAFELYMQARQSWSLRTVEGFARAEQMLRRALELAPDFVRAQAALIDVLQMRSLRERRVGSFGQRFSPEIDQRLEQVRQVLAADPNLAEAYSTLGQTLDSKWQRDEAGQAYRRATELNPNYATGRHWYGMHLAELGFMDEALAELKIASELDPFSFIILDNYGWLLDLAGKNDEALQMLDRAAALNPGFDQTIRAKVAVLAKMGRTAEAKVLARQLRNNQPELDDWTLGLAGLTEEARERLAAMDPRDVSNRFQALLAAGQRDEALAALADPAGANKGDLIDILYRPIFDTVRNDPRFGPYLTTLGLTEAHARAQGWRAAHAPDRKGGVQ